MKAKDVLKRARKILERNWVKNSYREQKSNGRYCYCAAGALFRASQLLKTGYNCPVHYNSTDLNFYRQELHPPVQKAINILNSIIPYKDITVFNDDLDTTHKEILEVFDQAIKKA